MKWSGDFSVKKVDSALNTIFKSRIQMNSELLMIVNFSVHLDLLDAKASDGDIV